MTAEELRIDDWVRDNDTLFQVTSYTLRCLELDIDNAAEIKPVPITPEILEELEFYKGQDGSLVFWYNPDGDISDRSATLELKPLTINPEYKWKVIIVSKIFTGKTFINNIHELQHLLDDARIKMEMEIG